MTETESARKPSPLALEEQPTDETEAMLIQKIALLEDHIRYNGRPRPPLEERCQALRQKVLSLESKISKAGTSEAASEYLQSAPESHFKQVTRHDFVSWLKGDNLVASSMHDNTASVEFPKKRKVCGSNDGNDISSMPSQNSSLDSPDGRSKRLRTQGDERAPCLRCKILKKRCDSLEPCSHCPTQSYDNEVDFWKVLGCFRGHLRRLSEIFCPAFSRSCQRTLVYRAGGIEIINFVLTKSRISEQKRRRILNLVRTRDDFCRLDDTSWDDTARREYLAMSGSSSVQYEGSGDGFKLQDYEAAWSALQAISMDRVHLSKTAYNLFTLIRLGNSFSKYDPTSWKPFELATRLLRQSTELYLLERLCAQIASGTLSREAPFDPTRSTPNTLVLVDLKADVEEFLSSFEEMCSRRAKLKEAPQIGCFYSLLVFGVAKSILTDAYSVRTSYEEPNPWSDEISTRISSGYKTLVSVFCWASKTDIFLQDMACIESKEVHRQLLQTQNMVRCSWWETLGIKSTKDFFLSLGMCSLPDGSYNGFFIQKFGLEKLPTISSKVTPATKAPKASGEMFGLIKSSELPMTVSSPNEETSPASASTFTATSGLTPSWESRGSSITPTTPAETPSTSSTFSDLRANDQTETSKLDSSTTSSPTTFTFVSHDASGVHNLVRTHGGRKGALQPATLKKSREIRRVGACWNCWVMKMPCSEGSICQRCEKRGTAFYPQCSRAPFVAYTDILLPEWIISDYSLQAISAYLNATTLGCTSQSIEVEVVTWADGFGMSWSVNYFKPVSDGSIQETYYDKDGNPSVASLPVGFLEMDIKSMGDRSLKKADELVKSPKFSDMMLGHNDSRLASTVLVVLLDYYHAMADKDKLIHDCFKLIALIHTTSRAVLFTSSSLPILLSHLHIEHRPEQQYSSRILDRQVKAIVFYMVVRLTTNVLAQLERIMRGRDRLFWPRCFAAILLLAFSIEQLEVNAGSYVQATKEGTSKSRAREPEDYCGTVEGGPYAQLSHLFHALYRTSRANQGGLNPFNGDFGEKVDTGFDEAEMKMISDIREKVMNNVEMLNERNRPLDFEARQEEFAKGCSGRLIAKFLLSFL
ncbi:hypothetical protein VTL71DRAFT_5698 [Oculimacula yallundae]|uniref:Zn(2)-C6 fungal-type domain-containing protein n=1 Tax=Oculimacula yallundae TaxID=86028 RepID=A0ABR4BZS0_9HELO